MYNEPYYYSKINALMNMYQPNTLSVCDTEAFQLNARALLQRASSKLQFGNLPRNWELSTGCIDFLLHCLLSYGFVAVSEDSKRGLWFNPCRLGGYDFYFQPTYVTVSNKGFLSGSKKLDVGKDCEILKLTPDYEGIMDVVGYYAEKLSLIDNAINTSLINSKVPYILGGKTKSAVAALKKMMDNINAGHSAVYYDTRIEDSGSLNDKDTPFHMVKLFSAGDYITDTLLEDRAKLLNAFDTEVGIQTLPYEKKERMVTSEADSKREDSIARATVWCDTINRSLELINNHYGTNITFKLREEACHGSEDNPNRNGKLSESEE